MEKGIIYKWTNKINNKCYIGKTCREQDRKKEHLRDRRYTSSFHNALDKYGIENFCYQILFEIQEEDIKKLNQILNEKEQYYIEMYNSFNKNYGYNLTKGGDGLSGYKLSEETIKRMSKAKKGTKGTKWTSEQREKIRKKQYGHKPYNNKEVVQISDDGQIIRIFESALKAAEYYGKYDNRSNITKACKYNRKSFGYKWKYLSEIEDNQIESKNNDDKKDSE